MAKDYTIENLYEPGYNSFSPSEDSPYLKKQGMIPASQLGLTTDPRTANQIAALSTSLNQGVAVLEVGTIAPQTFGQIPKQHFAEMRRKAKLSGAQVTLHAPIQGVDPAGFGQQGYEEMNRISVERQLKDVIEKAAIMDDKGNLPVTIHGSNTAGSTFVFGKNEKGEREKKAQQLVVVDRITGQINGVKEDEMFSFHPEIDKDSYEIKNFTTYKNRSSEKMLEQRNVTVWDDAMTKVEFQRENAERILASVDPRIQAGLLDGTITQNSPEVVDANRKMHFAREYLSEASRHVQSEFDKAYRIARDENDENKMKQLKEIAQKYSKALFEGEGKEIKEGDKLSKEKIMYSHIPAVQSRALGILVENLREVAPNQFVSMEKFATEKASETFANVAMHAYKLKGDKAPALSIENVYPEMGFSQGEDLANLVKASQDKFIKNAMKSKEQGGFGLSKSDAEKAAGKLIGVTFDVGHLNQMRKYGYEEKDLAEEAKKVAKYVNKVHLTDNFGFDDTHLPPGMGNVPFAALLEALGPEGAKAVKINEVGGWFEHFKNSPYPQILEAFGSPVYSSSTGPYWSQAGGFQQSYMEGYGMMLPQTNYQTFGAGFSQLPQNLGGSLNQQGGSRMGGGSY